MTTTRRQRIQVQTQVQTPVQILVQTQVQTPVQILVQTLVQTPVQILALTLAQILVQETPVLTPVQVTLAQIQAQILVQIQVLTLVQTQVQILVQTQVQILAQTLVQTQVQTPVQILVQILVRTLAQTPALTLAPKAMTATSIPVTQAETKLRLVLSEQAAQRMRTAKGPIPVVTAAKITIRKPSALQQTTAFSRLRADTAPTTAI